MRTILVVLMLCHAIHLPVPCPDLDGECRGVPIRSLTEQNAWHFFFLGIRPAADIDRGPFSLDDEGLPERGLGTPFDDVAVAAAVSDVGHAVVVAALPELACCDTAGSDGLAIEEAMSPPSRVPMHRRASVRPLFCTWRI
ncbi:hypothetical protein [Planctomyces sp. SH-PL14]|uniref:hypothetical protein n=1 Tax=Planctomyces sp. SH-PL14 TaxID=1632864 RepID=UPI00078B7832|nr:hypothetical protein [Planctomyces sp. SH-PL14]AMV16474.1 hypothetical protein VT03_01200 [Planctomyces sp. SH-PL14]